MKPVGVCIGLLNRVRPDETHIQEIEEWMDEQGIPWEYMDCYASDIISRLDDYSAIYWHYGNFVNADLMEAQHILDIAARKGVKVFPDYNTGWHFDDKVAESYALDSVGAPIPRYWVFYDYKTCIEWLSKEAKYPLIAKLRRGSGSNNVKMLDSAQEAKKYAKLMFTKGMSPAQSLVYKTYSKVQSTRDVRTFVKRLRKVPDFLKSRKFGKGLPIERGYCYFQEVIPNDGYDIKVAVVGDKLGYFARRTRKADFRASGGGDFYYDNALITQQIIDSAFAANDALGMQRIGFDYVVDNRTGEGKIIEMCFGFDADAVYNAGGYFDRSGTWHNSPLNVRVETLKRMLEEE